MMFDEQTTRNSGSRIATVLICTPFYRFFLQVYFVHKWIGGFRKLQVTTYTQVSLY